MKNVNNNTEINHAPVIRKAFFRFYEELNDHLPKKWKKQKFLYEFKGKPSVKNTIQAIGVPHNEVDLILVNGDSVGFDYQMTGGEYIAVYPTFESLDISSLIRLRAQPLRQSRFIVDVNLGKLAQKLRLLGFDTLFKNNFDDDEIIEIALSERRIILTRDKGILKQNAVTHGYWLRNDDPKKQLTELIDRLQLQNNFKPFTRCSNCNGKLHEIGKEQLKDRLTADTLSFYNKFWECTGCQKIYWQGSHFRHIIRWIDELKAQ